MPTLEQIRACFGGDRFASECLGAVIEVADPNHAVVSMTLRGEHCNALGNPMGGAIFTLADFAFAIAANAHTTHVTVSQNADIHFLTTAKGKMLRAEATCVKAGRTTSLYTVDVHDELGTHVAYVTISGFTVK
jgi:acyl-CoA thioesterase